MKAQTGPRDPHAREMHRPWRTLLICACFSAVGVNVTAPAAAAQTGSAASAVAPLIAHATDLGPASPSSPIEITVWLKLQDDRGLENTLSAQRQGGEGWLSDEQIQARHAPAEADVTAVSGFLKAQGLTVTGVGPRNLFVKATGAAAAVQAAFRVELHQYRFNGRTFRSANSMPTLPAGIAPLVVSVGGLSDLGEMPNIARAKVDFSAIPNVTRQTDIEGPGVTPKPIPLVANATPQGVFFSAQCFYPPAAVSFSGGGATANYQGTRYGADINNTVPGTFGPCAYQPTDLQTAYNMTPLYKAGLDGTGETIAIVDAYGSTTVAADLATFSNVMGLPPANLTIIGTPTETAYSGDANSTWALETTLDVEWAHAIAPGAKILLVVAPTPSEDDLFGAIATASMQPGVVAISNSWNGPESQTDVPSRSAADGVLRLANAKGQAVNFGSGDRGNEASLLGYADVDYPGTSPYATSVGGVSVVLDASKHIAFQTSWGTNITEIADAAFQGSPPLDPPNNLGFAGGGGGGTSSVYPLPGFQHRLGGLRRLVPDISWVADPLTGVEILYTGNAQGDVFIAVAGGTSLATPMFSALWSIATQRAHHPLGQAAPYLYELPPGAITDVQAARSSPENVTGVLIDAAGTQNLTSWDLAVPLQGQQSFISALFNSPASTLWYVVTFGTDSTLRAGPGWDPATGLGTPNGWDFVQAFGSDRRVDADNNN